TFNRMLWAVVIQESWNETISPARHRAGAGRNPPRLPWSSPGRRPWTAGTGAHAVDHLPRHRLAGAAAPVRGRAGVSEPPVQEPPPCGPPGRPLLRRRARRQDLLLPGRPAGPQSRPLL